VNFVFLQKAVSLSAEIDKNGLKTWNYPGNNPLVNVSLDDFPGGAFDEKLLQLAFFDLCNPAFLNIKGINEKLGAHMGNILL
jgi:hypothetical protein